MYFNIKWRSINSLELESYFSWARKATLLSKLECWRRTQCSFVSRLSANSVSKLIFSSEWFCFLSWARINFISVSKHLRLLESTASSSISSTRGLLLWALSCLVSFDVSRSGRFEPTSFLGCSSDSSLFLYGEYAFEVADDTLYTFSTWKILWVAVGTLILRAMMVDKSSY